MGPYKYIQAPRPELYDFGTDPGELNNILTKHQQEAQRLQAELKTLLARYPRAGAVHTGASPQSDVLLHSLGYLSGVKQVLIHLEVEHHLEPFTARSEILHVGCRLHVGLRQHDGIAFTPTEKLTELAEHLVLFHRLGDLRAFRRDHKRHRIHAKSGNAELNPEAHYLQKLGLHVRTTCIQVGLKFIEAAEIPASVDFIVTPSCFLHAGANHAALNIFWFFSSTTRTSRGISIPDRGAPPETRDAHRMCD